VKIKIKNVGTSPIAKEMEFGTIHKYSSIQKERDIGGNYLTLCGFLIMLQKICFSYYTYVMTIIEHFN
jgi:hypothetical protein